MPKKEVIKKSAAKKAPIKKNILKLQQENEILKSVKKHGKLPKDFKRDWIEALKSDKFKQGSNGYLREVTFDDKNKKIVLHCCLGVACQIAGASGIINKSMISNTDEATPIKSINKVPLILQSDKLQSNLIPNVLANLNDTGKSFKEIATVIQKYL